MDELVFQVQGSAPEPYVITIRRRDGEVLALCTCQAGENGLHCKHRIAILSGENPGVLADADKLPLVVAWLPGTKLAASLAEFATAEESFRIADLAFKSVKKKLGRTMFGGK